MPPSNFGVNWPFGSGEEAKNRFSRWQPWRPSWISDRNDFSYFWSQVTPMLPNKFGVNWPFRSGEEAKNRFSRWRPSWISYQNDFSYFWSTGHPNTSYQVSSQLAQGCRRSRLLKQLLTPHDGHWLSTKAHHEHFVLRWANKTPPKKKQNKMTLWISGGNIHSARGPRSPVSLTWLPEKLAFQLKRRSA